MLPIRWVLPVILGGAAFGQSAPPRLEFEVASIKPSDMSSQNTVRVGLHIDGAMVRCSFFSLKDYIGMAYNVKEYQITGPDWMAGERFEINAKLPAGATQAQVPEMIQSLLADRFQLKFHRDSREFPVYALVAAKSGIKIKETPPDADAAATDKAANGNVNVAAQGGPQGVVVDIGNGGSFAFDARGFDCRKIPMPRFADTLARFMDRPVVDLTGLQGNYDFKLPLTPDDQRAMSLRSAITAGVVLPPDVRRMAEGASYDSLFSALEAVGLKLERRKSALEVLVIDKIEKSPTAN
jgi:uncharacterized protein (TIGR03435 family)